MVAVQKAAARKANAQKTNGLHKTAAAARPRRTRSPAARALRAGKMIALGSLLFVGVLALIGGTGLLLLAANAPNRKEGERRIRHEIARFPERLHDTATAVRRWAA